MSQLLGIRTLNYVGHAQPHMSQQCTVMSRNTYKGLHIIQFQTAILQILVFQVAPPYLQVEANIPL